MKQIIDSQGNIKMTGAGGGGGNTGSISAGTTIGTLGQIVFSNSNNVSFGINGQTITASIPAAAAQGSVSAGTTNVALGEVVFSNSNGISFGLNGSTITGTVATNYQSQGAYLTTAMLSNAATISNIKLSAGTLSALRSDLTFNNSNGVSFGLETNGIITATVKTDYLTTAMASNRGSDFVQATAAFAGTNASGTIASDGISVSVNAQSAVPQNASLYALGNTTQNSSTQLSVNALSFNAIGSITIGYSNGSIQVSAPNALTSQSNQAFSAEGGSSAFQTLIFTNSNGFSFSNTGGSIWGSHNALTSQSNQAASASNGSFTFQTLNFSNANNVTFGTSAGGIVTASVAAGGGLTNINVSAGTTSNNLSALTFANSNGVSFGLDGSTITATVKTDYLTTAMASNRGSDFVQATAVFNGTNASGTIASDAISVSVAAQSNQNISLYGLGNTTQNSSTVLNASNLSFNAIGSLTVGYSNGSIQLSAANALTTAMASNRGSDFVQANAVFNGTNASGTIASNAISVSVAPQSNQNVSLYALGNTTQNSSTVLNASNLSFNAIGSITMGYSNGSIQVSAANALTSQSNQAFSAEGGSSAFQTLVFTNSNGFSFSNTGGSIWGSYTVPTVTNSSFSVQDSATTINPVARIAFSTGNNITLSLSTGASSATVGVQHNLAGTSTGFGGNLISASMTHNSSGLNLSLNHPAWLTTAALSGDTTKYVQAWELTGNTAGTTSSLQGTKMYFEGGNSITVSGTSNTIKFSVGNYLTTAMASNRGSDFVQATAAFNGTNASGTIASNAISVSVAAQTNQTLGIYASSNTTMTSSGTIDARSLSFRGIGIASVGYSNNEVLISVPAGAPSPVNFSAGAASGDLGSVVFSNSNNMSFGLNGSTITASFNAINIGVSTFGNTAGTTGTVEGAGGQYIFVGTNGVMLSQSTNGAASGTVTIDGGRPTLSYWNNLRGLAVTANSEQENASLYIRPLYGGDIFPGNMTANTMFLNITGTVSTAQPFTRSVWFGVYTLVNSTQLSRLYSALTSWGTGAANMNANDSFAGYRWLTLHSSAWNAQPVFSQTHYWLGIVHRSSSGSQSFSLFGEQSFLQSAARSGFMSVASANNATEKWHPFMGYYSATTAGIPDAIGASELSKGTAGLQFIPHIQFNNIGSNIV